MNDRFELSEYLNRGVEDIVKGIIKASMRNPKESAFILKFALSCGEARRKRDSLGKKGENIPGFLISSITSNCNLFCRGCYARANKSCGEGMDIKQLPAERWGEIFREARELGISFVLLAGGEPLMRKDVLEKAAEVSDIIFPVFTNGTLLRGDYIKLFDSNRNLVPILSLEGSKEQTDGRRGKGVHDTLMGLMDILKKKGILFGISVTVTKENIRNLTESGFYGQLYDKGCRAIIFVEYVPVAGNAEYLAPGASEREILDGELQVLRETYEDMILLAFPGDEKYSGGCLAAGRGFFHINADGSAEPCPFSPFSDMNLKECTLKEALKSQLFRRLEETGMLLGEHQGGCVLFGQEAEVMKLLGKG
ncbi:MAG TPA: radical SAM protein [Bacillota bacterium]|nr:radical SAM protein [Bacillota bacterium]